MKKLLLSACVAAAAFWMNDAGAMNGSDIVCEAYSLGRSKEDVALLRCKKFPNLEQIEIEDEEAWVFIGNNKERFPKLKKITGCINQEGLAYAFSVYEYDDEYSGDSACGMKRILQGMTELPVVEEIYLREWRLNSAGGLPESIKNLKSLRVLKIENCRLWRLPESIGCLKNLEILDLGNFLGMSFDFFVLSGNSVDTLPKTIGNLKNLKELNLAYCDLKELPETIGNLENLQILNLRGSSLQSLPESMKKLSKLKKLDLRDRNSLSLRSTIRIPDFLWEMPSLEEVFVDEDV